MTPRSSVTLREAVERHLSLIYPELPTTDRYRVADHLVALVDDAASRAERARTTNEVALITYGDTFQSDGQPHLHSLAQFLEFCGPDLFSTIHVLPFFPSSSDGGFSITNYEALAEGLGEWDDIAALASPELMVDLVCNHGSAQSEWFRQFKEDREPGRDMFLTAAPTDDLSSVVRPRTHDLLAPVETVNGIRHAWATFSHDQIDFDFSNPDVLFEFSRLLVSYIERGATRVRLDAIGYIWKELGTSCIHLPQTHQIVKLMRTLVDAIDPSILLITETNVPHGDNVSYFGDGDEAHVVYNFTLAPLIVWSLLAGRADRLTTWLRELEAPPAGCAFFNFLASHDGIGLRPLEGIVPANELDPVIDAVKSAGGDYSSFSTPDGPRPYELNVSLVDLLAGPDGQHPERFLVAHALMLALDGIAAVYVHSLLVSPGDLDAVAVTGHKRDINRARITLDAAQDQVTSGWRGEVHERLKHLLRLRQSHPEFELGAPQVIRDVHPNVVAVQRGELLAIHNMSGETVQVAGIEPGHDLISDKPTSPALALSPWQTSWIIPTV